MKLKLKQRDRNKEVVCKPNRSVDMWFYDEDESNGQNRARDSCEEKCENLGRWFYYWHVFLRR